MPTAWHRRHRRDGGGRAQPRRRWRPVPRRPEDDLFRGDHQHRHPAGAPARHRGADRTGQEPPLRGPLESGQRARVPYRCRPAPTSSPCSTAAREADPSRPGRVRQHDVRPARHCTVTELADVVMINRYYGWYVEPGDLEAAERGLEAELWAWADDARQAHHRDRVRSRRHVRPPHHSMARVWSEEYQVALLETYHRSSTALTPSWASTSGTSRTSPPDRPSCGSTATRKACSPGTGGRRWPHTTCGGAGSALPDACRSNA